MAVGARTCADGGTVSVSPTVSSRKIRGLQRAIQRGYRVGLKPTVNANNDEQITIAASAGMASPTRAALKLASNSVNSEAAAPVTLLRLQCQSDEHERAVEGGAEHRTEGTYQEEGKRVALAGWFQRAVHRPETGDFKQDCDDAQVVTQQQATRRHVEQIQRLPRHQVIGVGRVLEGEVSGRAQQSREN